MTPQLWPSIVFDYVELELSMIIAETREESPLDAQTWEKIAPEIKVVTHKALFMPEALTILYPQYKNNPRQLALRMITTCIQMMENDNAK